MPIELQGSGGTVYASAMDAAPPSASFFPNASFPASPCVSEPLQGSEHPGPHNAWSFPTWSFPIAPAEETVRLTDLRMKQWMIVWFETEL